MKADASLLNTKGVILIRLGRYEEAIGVFDEAFNIEANHLLMFNKAVAFLRLNRFNDAEDAMQRAVELCAGDTQFEKDCHRHLERLRKRSQPIIWSTWWFGEGGKVGWVKRCAGGVISVLLLAYLLMPLVSLNTALLQEERRLWWMSFGRDWQTYLIPVAALVILLLSPMLKSIGPQGVELSPAFTPPEIRLRDIAKDIQPKFD